MRKFLVLFLSLAMVIACCSLASAEAYTEQDITIDAGDHQIPATLTLPEAVEGKTYPAVIMLHGNGSTRHEAGNAYDFAAPEMAKAGIATIRFDYIGNGDSTSDYIDFTYDKGVEDAMKCYDYLATLGTIDMDHVGIMGWSQGGRLALLTAGRNDVFTSVCTWAGAYDQKGSECAMSIDYAKEVANIKAPILAINGKEDTVVPPETAQEIVDVSTNPDSQVLLLDGADHTFCVFSGDDTVLRTLVQDTIDWFNRTL